MISAHLLCQKPNELRALGLWIWDGFTQALLGELGGDGAPRDAPHGAGTSNCSTPFLLENSLVLPRSQMDLGQVSKGSGDTSQVRGTAQVTPHR